MILLKIYYVVIRGCQKGRLMQYYRVYSIRALAGINTRASAITRGLGQWLIEPGIPIKPGASLPTRVHFVHQKYGYYEGLKEWQGPSNNISSSNIVITCEG